MRRTFIVMMIAMLGVTGCSAGTGTKVSNDDSAVKSTVESGPTVDKGSNKQSNQESNTTPSDNGSQEPAAKDDSTWPLPKLPFQFDWEKSTRPENVFLSTAVQGNSSWIMLTSGPAAGLMDKTLYQTSDGGKTWVYVKDVSVIVDGYVTGISFRSDKEGWIAATQHGEVMLPLYRTTDGGKSWSIQKITIPAEYKYGNAYPPVFDSKNPLLGTLKIEFVNDDERTMVSYSTTDGGQTWKPLAE